MKFLSSSSSSSTASFDANMCNSRNATAGCFAGVLRRLLCSGSLPTHPSDHIRDSGLVVFGKDENLKAGEKMEGVATPGIVARLMGLDSMPEINLVCSQIKVNSIVRSRSMNSMDFWPDSEAMQGKHRRVKSSLSFRETPVFFEMENEEYLLLSFGNEGETKELRQKERKCEMGSGELRQRTTERCGNKNTRRQRVSEKKDKEDGEARKNVPIGKENTNRSVSDQPSQMVCNNGEVKDFPAQDSFKKPQASSEDGAKLRDKKKKSRSATKKVEPECSSENSSPVSVLDFGECINDPELPIPENTSSSIGDNGEAKKIEGKCTGSRKTACHGQKYLGMWVEICRLAGGEMMESSWLHKEIKKHEDFEDLGADFGLHILDELLQELVDHLCELPMKNFDL
ncbi:hypothetical protein PVL29_007655 [Vitis rotundifolia]|uniref:DUF3741 domain-containing protein n=1 Tax=Vitis rotundifolia TaxID=103349 RepID=A0AA39DX37_VITRO|nr:hypothetical protein PVL29_007655 [Vitis rotundifolia]